MKTETANNHNGLNGSSYSHAAKLPTSAAPSTPLKARRSFASSVINRAKASAAHVHDMKTRRRNEVGDRLEGRYVYSTPIIEDIELAKTPMAKAVALIEQEHPLLAHEIHTSWDHVTRQSLQRLHAVRREEEDNMAAYNAMAAAHNGEIESAQASLESDRDRATADDRQTILDLDAPLAEAHKVAAEKVSKTGGVYDASNPLDVSIVLRHERIPLEALAAEIDAPMPTKAAVRTANWFGWVMVVIVGLLMGISIGIISGICQPDPRSLCRDWPVTLAAWAVGFGIAGGTKFAVKYLWYLAGQYCYFSRPAHRWTAALVTAIIGSLVLLGSDMAVEQQGLLAMRHAHEILVSVGGRLGGADAPSNDGVMLWVAMIVSLGLIVCAAVEGYIDGRLHVIVTRLTRLQNDRFREQDTSRRSEPAIQAALGAIGNVGELLHRHVGLSERVAKTAMPFDAEIERLETEKKPLLEDLPEGSRRRVQDARDDLQGAQGEWNALYRYARFICEPSPRWYQRIFTPRGPRNRWKDRQRKG